MPWPRRPPHKDSASVGITFVDVLFALVIGEILTPLRHYHDLPGYGVTHLGVAAVLTLTSWVGYHNSHNRPQYLIRFVNKPLAQFVLDILMVLAYWLAAVSAEIPEDGRALHPSANPEAGVVLAAFCLYVLWDIVAREIRRDERYRARPVSRDVPGRRNATYVGFLIALVIAAVVEVSHPDTSGAVYVVDIALIVLLVGYRLLKEYWTPFDLFDDSVCQECQRPFAEAAPG